MKRVSLISVLLSFTVTALADEPTYLCVSEESTGFVFEKGSWRRANFNVADEKYIVRRIKEDEFGFKDKDNPYGVFALGENFPEFRCSISEDSKNYICRIGLGQFLFSPKSGRFIKTYTSGYWDGADNSDNTPHITRGRCSKI